MKNQKWIHKLYWLLLITSCLLGLAGCVVDNQADTETQVSAGQKRHVAHVTASIKQVEGTVKGHQHLIVDHIHVIDTQNMPAAEVESEAFVAIRYGDSLGLTNPISDLKPGTEIELQGEYIDRKHAGKSRDNPGDPVLHFTHHPLGYVVYKGHKYE